MFLFYSRKRLRRLFAFLCFLGFFYSCIFFFSCQMANQESLIQNWKGNLRKHFFFFSGRKKESKFWTVVDFQNDCSYCWFHVFFLKNDENLEALPYFLLNSRSDRFSSGNTKLSNVTVGVSLTQLPLVETWNAVLPATGRKEFPLHTDAQQKYPENTPIYLLNSALNYPSVPASISTGLGNPVFLMLKCSCTLVVQLNGIYTQSFFKK